MMLTCSQASYVRPCVRLCFFKILFIYVCVTFTLRLAFLMIPKWLPEGMAPFVHVGGGAEFKKDCFPLYGEEV